MSNKEKALENLKRLLGDRSLQDWRLIFDRIECMPNSQTVLKHILECEDKNGAIDHLAAVRYASVFSRLNFEVEFEPFGRAGPDLEIRKHGNAAIVEVTRFRKVSPGPLLLRNSDEPELLPYGDLARDFQKAWSKIIGKFSQVDGAESIIAIWNDDGDLEEIEVQQTVKNLFNAANRNDIVLPENAGFILYGSPWIGEGPNPLGRQFYCYPLSPSLQPHHLRWILEIESFLLTELV